MVKRKQVKRVTVERSVLERAQSPFVVHLEASFRTPTHLYMVQTYCAGGLPVGSCSSRTPASLDENFTRTRVKLHTRMPKNARLFVLFWLFARKVD